MLTDGKPGRTQSGNAMDEPDNIDEEQASRMMGGRIFAATGTRLAFRTWRDLISRSCPRTSSSA